MDADTARHFARRWFQEVWNEGNDATIDELLTPDFEFTATDGSRVRGLKQYRQFHEQIRSAFGELRAEVVDVISDGMRVFVRYVWNVRHTGSIFGIPPTHRRASVQGMAWVHVETAGREQPIASAVWNQMDWLAFFHQIGQLPPMLGAAGVRPGRSVSGDPPPEVDG